jgi:aryl-phospho-beta-D-glucosidase BglC (GH1 family)
MWKKISDKFKNEDIVAGYDLMNEPVLKFKNWAKCYLKCLIKQ